MLDSDILKLMERGGSITAGLYLRRRELPEALAGAYVGTKPTDAKRLGVLNNLFVRLSTADRVKVRHEIDNCRAARRSHIFRGVA